MDPTGTLNAARGALGETAARLADLLRPQSVRAALACRPSSAGEEPAPEL